MNKNNNKFIYNDLWQQSILRFKNGQFELDDLIHDPSDSRRGITLLTRFDAAILQNIDPFIAEGKGLEPDQYYYKSSDVHITVLSIISCDQKFNLSQIRVPEYVKIIQECLDDFKSFAIQISGITASPSCVMLQGFTEESQLESLRNDLRKRFQNSTLEHSIDKRYSIKAAHSTVIRFTKPLNDINHFIDYLYKYRDFYFGEFKVQKLELVFNDWYQKSENTILLHSFELT